MKLHYYPETDSLYIELTAGPAPKRGRLSRDWSPTWMPTAIVEIDIDHASRKLDLSRVENIALPPASAAE